MPQPHTAALEFREKQTRLTMYTSMSGNCTVASLRLVSPGAVTDDATLFLPQKVMTYLVIAINTSNFFYSHRQIQFLQMHL